jgi:RimJ/RimL family protein N-acetyltransferase
MKTYLETERLVLRRFTNDDVDNLCELDSDPEVLRFINGGTPTPRHVIQEGILPGFLSFYERYEELGFWAAVEKTSGEFVGWFALHPEGGRDAHDLALGYRLRRKCWGRGYGTEVTKALIHKAFADLAARRVFACTYSENIASRRVMEKSGMKLARTYRMTPTELASAMTHVSTRAVWPSEDVEYAVDREAWETALA